MRSLASELLQEVEILGGSERQKKEKVVKMTLGTIFTGKASYSWMMHGLALTYRIPSQLVQTP